MEIKIKKLVEAAVIPTQNKDFDAGYDLYSLETYNLRPQERKLFKTGIAISIPPGFYGRVAERSGNSLNKGIEILGGVIDANYRGELGVIVKNGNGGDETNVVLIQKGDRIAQIIIEVCAKVEWKEVDNLDETDRAANGFGSSGN